MSVWFVWNNGFRDCGVSCGLRITSGAVDRIGLRRTNDIECEWRSRQRDPSQFRNRFLPTKTKTGWRDSIISDNHAQINGWEDKEKALWLSIRLKGNAQLVYQGLSKDEKKTYTDLTKALTERFAPAERSSVKKATLKARRRLPGETLVDFASAKPRPLQSFSCVLLSIVLLVSLKKKTGQSCPLYAMNNDVLDVNPEMRVGALCEAGLVPLVLL